MNEQTPHHIVGIDLGSEQIACGVYTPIKTRVLKLFELLNHADRFAVLHSSITGGFVQK